MNLLEELKSVLKKDERLVSDDKLLKNRIVELGLKLDKNLIKLLLRACRKIKWQIISCGHPYKEARIINNIRSLHPKRNYSILSGKLLTLEES